MLDFICDPHTGFQGSHVNPLNAIKNLSTSKYSCAVYLLALLINVIVEANSVYPDQQQSNLCLHCLTQRPLNISADDKIRRRSKTVLLLWIFYVFDLSCVCYVLCASVYMCFVVTCWERADLLALVCGVFCEFITFPLVSWVRCGT